jgi:hypothetical protein
MSAPTSAPLIRWNGKEHPPFNRELLGEKAGFERLNFTPKL